MALADQIVVMHSGRVEQAGTYKTLIENPLSLFVAGFLGLPPMDLFPSGPVSDGRLVLGEYAFPLPEAILPLLQNGQQITLGLRRETVKVFPEIEFMDGVHLQAQIEAFESRFYTPQPDSVPAYWTIPVFRTLLIGHQTSRGTIRSCGDQLGKSLFL